MVRQLPLAAFLLAFSMAISLADPACMGDPELMAEVAERYLVEQEYNAVTCSYLFKESVEKEPGDLLFLVRDIAKKFEGQFSRYRETRRRRFQRLFEQRWRQALALDREAKLKKLKANQTRLELKDCISMGDEWAIIFKGDWPHLKEKLDATIEKIRPDILMCDWEENQAGFP